jgi:hypothetical protein
VIKNNGYLPGLPPGHYNWLPPRVPAGYQFVLAVNHTDPISVAWVLSTFKNSGVSFGIDDASWEDYNYYVSPKDLDRGQKIARSIIRLSRFYVSLRPDGRYEPRPHLYLHHIIPSKNSWWSAPAQLPGITKTFWQSRRFRDFARSYPMAVTLQYCKRFYDPADKRRYGWQVPLLGMNKDLIASSETYNFFSDGGGLSRLALIPMSEPTNY